MNKLLRASAFLVVLFLSLTTAQAQFLEETKTIGGGIGFWSQSSVNENGPERRENSFNLNANGGYFLQDNMEIGLSTGLSIWNLRQLGNGGSEPLIRSGLFHIGPYARIYNPITDVVGLFAEGGFAAGFGGGSIDVRRRTFEVGIRPGVILMVNENLGLETTIGVIGYHRTASGNKDNYRETRTATNIVRASFDLSTINFGFRLYLRN